MVDVYIIISTGTLDGHARTDTGTPHLDRVVEWFY